MEEICGTENVGKFDTVRDTLDSSSGDKYLVAAIVLFDRANLPAVDAMGYPSFRLAGVS